jgi:redox-sensitive bicupin YhaK (pirin superfamily)
MKAGWAQRISAGTGIFHSEFNASDTDPVHLLQIWILPERKGVKPGYAEKSFTGAPAGRWNLVASHGGREDSLAIHQDADLWLAKLAKTDALTRELRPGRHAWVHLAEGDATVNGQPLKSGDALAISGEPRVSVEARGPSQVLLFDLN